MWNIDLPLTCRTWRNRDSLFTDDVVPDPDLEIRPVGGGGGSWDLRASVWFKNKAGGGFSRPLPWIRHYDDTFYVSATALTVVKDQWELSNRATWTKDHPKKPRYMVIGTRQKLSPWVESALPLWLDVQQLDQTQEERLFIGLDTRPLPFLAIPWCSSKKRVAVLAHHSS